MALFLFFLSLPFMVWLFAKHKTYGLYAALTVAIISFGFRFVAAIVTHEAANRHVQPPYDDGVNDGVAPSLILYSGFVACYYCGVTLAFLMVIIDEKNSSFKLRRWQYFVTMIIAGAMMLSVVVTPYDDVKNAPDDRWNMASNGWYSALCKIAWV